MATIDTVQSDIALMLDIETLSLRPDAHVTQIGYCVANTRTREMLVEGRNLWMLSDPQADRHIDTGTVRWWLNQDPKVIATVLAPSQRTSPQEAFDILAGIVKANEGITVWGSPAMFDLPILTSLWGGRKPWRYNYERDMMTLYKVLDPQGAMQPPAADGHMGHDAATDAKWQMEYLFNLLHYLRALQPAPVSAGA